MKRIGGVCYDKVKKIEDDVLGRILRETQPYMVPPSIGGAVPETLSL